MQNSIHYQIQPIPEKHLFEVNCIIAKPDPKGQRLALPAWIPGSYLVRDFSKHIISMEARSEHKISIEALDKNTWICQASDAPLTITYQVYAYDLVPRGAHVDTTHAFLNGSRVFLQVLGSESMNCTVDILAPQNPKYHHWRVGTSLPTENNQDHAFGRYFAENYDELIDHPIEMGEFEVLNFEACAVPHELIITGKHQGDLQRLQRDVVRICEYHIEFFGLPAPMKKYCFLLYLLNEGVGGLEHKSSSALQCRRDYLPKVGDEKVSEGYGVLLGLISHEYFHTWNVKRIKPKVFAPYDLTKENYTRQLWIFEGITSYYDELALVRTGLISKEMYLEWLGKLLTSIYATPGRLKQTLEQSSFETWIKFYKPDENSLNATISYYSKGALVALALDCLLRRETNHQHSLDTVMKALWQRFGLKEQGLPEDGFENLVAELTGCHVEGFFDEALRSTNDLPLEALLQFMGLRLTFFPAGSIEDQGGKKPQEEFETLLNRPLLDVKLKPNMNDAQLSMVFEGGAAEAAGLAPFDVIIAVNRIKVDRNRLEAIIAQQAIGDEILIQAFRRDELMDFKVKLKGAWLQTCVLMVPDTITEKQKISFNRWLGVLR